MVELPVEAPDTTPPFDTVATPVLVEVQEADGFLEPLDEYVPVRVVVLPQQRCTSLPEMEAFDTFP